MASKHIVVCQNCGRQFDANKGGYYNKTTRRYTCKACGNQAKTGMKQSKCAMIAKIFFGLMFIIVGIAPPEPNEFSVSTFLIGLVIGVALIAWGIMPYIKAKKIEKAEAEQAELFRRKLADQVVICPHCGARTKGNVCEYCGSPIK